jgi:5-formyltetrahydrofolate cyclo-ligase
VGIDWEVPTHEFIKEALTDGKRVALPYCKNDGLRLGIGEITDFFRDVALGKYGIPEPVARVRDTLLINELNLILCPGVAFDMSGGRLGRGMGYYDRFLAGLPHAVPVWGIGFSCQMHSEGLPVGLRDVAVNGLVTENGFCSNNR